MEIRRFQFWVVLSGFCGAGAAILTYYVARVEEFVYMLYLPVEILAKGLRSLSLNSGLGDVMAWILYIFICMIPILLVVSKRVLQKKDAIIDETGKKKKCASLPSLLLVLLSLYMFVMLYLFINPGLMLKPILPMGGADLTEVLPVMKLILVSMAYSLIIGYAVLSFSFDLNRNNIWKKTEKLLMLGTGIYGLLICYILPLKLFQQLEQTAGAGNSVIVLLLIFYLDVLPLACLVGVAEAGVRLIHKLRDDRYSADSVKAAELLTIRSKRTVIAAVVCNILQNGIQIFFCTTLIDTNFLVNVPFLPLILAFVGVILAEHIKESLLLYEENKSFI